MLSALSQSSVANNNSSNRPSQSRSQSPTKKSSSALKTEPELEIRRINELQEEQGSYGGDQEGEPSSTVNYDNSNNNRMDYANDDSVHPLAPVPHSFSDSSSSRRNSSAHPSGGSVQSNYYTSSPAIQPQQHQQLLKLKTEHGFSSSPAPVPESATVTHHEDMDERSAGSSRRASSSEVNVGGPGELVMMKDDRGDQDNDDDNDDGNDLDESSHRERGHHLMVDTSTQAIRHDAGATTPSSRRGSLRTMTATLPRSALQEETISLFKQYRNLIPCAKCFCRNTIQRDGMSDGNLRFKCRPPVSMSLICNKSYSESKIRNMIAGVVYGHSLPDSATSATSPGENVLALAPPPPVKPSRRASTKNDGSPRLGAEITSERLKRLKEDPENEQGPENPLQMERDHEDRMGHQHPLDGRRPSLPLLHQGPVSRRASVQQLRRPSLVEDESMMMDYEDMPSSQQATYLQVPGTPPMDGEDPRLYRSRPGYSQQPRSVTPTGPPHSSSGGPPPPSGRQGGQKLHHSHSHPNIGQQRHQQYLEQQEREHRGSFSGQGHPGQSSQPQRPLQRPLAKRESIQHLGGGPERRSSQPSPNLGSKYLPGPGSMHESHSPAMASSPRSSPGRDMGHHHSHGSSSHEQSGTPTVRSLPGSAWYEESNQGYLSRRMSQPHPGYGYSGHSGLPPAMPSPLSHPYDRRASEIEDYPPVHRAKYEKLNASTLLAPGPNGSSSSSSSLSRHSLQKMKPLAHPVSPNSAFESRQHPLDPAEPETVEEGGSRQSLTPYSRSGPGGNSSSNVAPTSPWLGGGSNGPATPQSEPMRYSHSMGNSNSSNNNTGSGGSGGSYGGPRPSLRHQSSLSNIYYHTPRQDDRDRFEADSEMDMSPEYHEVDADGRPIARMRHQGLKRKSLGQPLGRSSSHQNLYATSLQHSHHSHSSQQQHQHRDHHHRDHHHHHHNQHQAQHHHQQHQQHPVLAPRGDHHHDLNAALPPPPNGIKMTCFPNALSKTAAHPSPTTKTMDSSEAMALPLSQCSKIVIEIHQPRNAQAYTSGISLVPSRKKEELSLSFSDDAAVAPVVVVDQQQQQRKPIAAAAAQLARSSSSIIGHRRSASRDLVSYGACKKRRADSVRSSASEKDSLEEEDEDAAAALEDENEESEDSKTSSGVAEAAAAAVVAVAAQANKKSEGVEGEEKVKPEHTAAGTGIANADADAASTIQVFGLDYLSQHSTKQEEGLLGLGLGLPSSSSSSLSPMTKTVDALQVARASSYVVLEDQKEMGVDYSLFTRVETAGWRILIPPNVVASFRSDDFGLMLKPKGLDVEMNEDRQGQQAQGQGQGQQQVKKEGNVAGSVVERGGMGVKLSKGDYNDNDSDGSEIVFGNDDEDVNTEGVRRIALRDDDHKPEDVKPVNHPQPHHNAAVAQDLEMQVELE
ncbi:hypothetical protein BGX33_004019 [Mortierella sp. NVP41]|nr:hypothetical protein BGX33_004019 [Mortierella sp. NVP41]